MNDCQTNVEFLQSLSEIIGKIHQPVFSELALHLIITDLSLRLKASANKILQWITTVTWHHIFQSILTHNSVCLIEPQGPFREIGEVDHPYYLPSRLLSIFRV